MQLPSTKVVTIPEFVNATFVARLARAVVMELQPLDRILEEFKLTRDQFEVIKLTSYFKRVCEEFSAEWNRISSTQDRLRLISAVLLEEGLPRVGSHMIDPNVTAAAAVEAGKFLAKVAGVGEGSKAGEAVAGDRFTITINLGNDQQLNITKDVSPKTSGPETSFLEEIDTEISADAERKVLPQGADLSVSEKPEGEVEATTVETDGPDGDSICKKKLAKS